MNVDRTRGAVAWRGVAPHHKCLRTHRQEVDAEGREGGDERGPVLDGLIAGELRLFILCVCVCVCVRVVGCASVVAIHTYIHAHRPTGHNGTKPKPTKAPPKGKANTRTYTP